MSSQADVRSLDTLAFVKSALATFSYECGQALSEVELEGRRGVEWITVDRAGYWKAEIRKRSDKVNEAMKDLEHCRTFKKVGDNQPSCVEEKKALERARRRLAVAEQKAEAVRHWSPIVQQQFQETGVRLVHFREVLDGDIPKAVAKVERMLKALDAYRDVSGPASRGADSGSGEKASVRRAEADTADEAPAGGTDAAVASEPAREE